MATLSKHEWRTFILKELIEPIVMHNYNLSTNLLSARIEGSYHHKGTIEQALILREAQRVEGADEFGVDQVLEAIHDDIVDSQTDYSHKSDIYKFFRRLLTSKDSETSSPVILETLGINH